MEIRTEGRLKSVKKIPEEKIPLAMQKYAARKDLYKDGHFQEQLYLMIKWGFSDSLISSFVDNELRLQDIDFFRFLILLTNDFEFIEKRFLNQNFIYEDALSDTLDFIIETKYSVLKEIEVLRDEKENLQKEYERQVEFLQKEFDYNTQFKEMQHTYEKEVSDLKTQHVKERAEAEKAVLQEKIDELSIQLAKTENELRSVCATHLINTPQKEEIIKKKGGVQKLLSILKPKKSEEKTKNKFILDVFYNQMFKPEQYKIILEALENGLPLENIKQLANPNLQVESMEMLCQMFYRQHGITEHTKILMSQISSKHKSVASAPEQEMCDGMDEVVQAETEAIEEQSEVADDTDDFEDEDEEEEFYV